MGIMLCGLRQHMMFLFILLPLKLRQDKGRFHASTSDQAEVVSFLAIQFLLTLTDAAPQIAEQARFYRRLRYLAGHIGRIGAYPHPATDMFAFRPRRFPGQ